MGILTGRAVCLVQESAGQSLFRGQRAMANDDKPSKAKRQSDQMRAKLKAPGDRPFDLWLQKQLHAMYDEIASEPLPDNLLDLIDKDAGKKDPKIDK